MYICAAGPGFHGCGKIGRLAEPIDELVTEAVLFRIDTPAVAQALQTGTGAQGAAPALEDLSSDQALLDDLARAYADKKVSLNEWLIARDPIERRIAASNRRLAEQNQRSILADVVRAGATLREEWNDLSIDRKRAIIATVLDHAMVQPALLKGVRRFDPSRIEPVWRL